MPETVFGLSAFLRVANLPSNEMVGELKQRKFHERESGPPPQIALSRAMRSVFLFGSRRPRSGRHSRALSTGTTAGAYPIGLPTLLPNCATSVDSPASGTTRGYIRGANGNYWCKIDSRDFVPSRWKHFCGSSLVNEKHNAERAYAPSWIRTNA